MTMEMILLSEMTVVPMEWSGIFAVLAGATTRLVQTVMEMCLERLTWIVDNASEEQHLFLTKQEETAKETVLETPKQTIVARAVTHKKGTSVAFALEETNVSIVTDTSMERQLMTNVARVRVETQD